MFFPEVDRYLYNVRRRDGKYNAVITTLLPGGGRPSAFEPPAGPVAASGEGEGLCGGWSQMTGGRGPASPSPPCFPPPLVLSTSGHNASMWLCV